MRRPSPTPAGWTQIGSPTVRSTVATYQFFWKRAASGAETNPLIDRTATTGDVYAAVITYRGAITTGDPWEVKGTVATGTTDPSVITGTTTLTANTLVVVAAAGEDDNNGSIITTGTDPANYTEHYVESPTGTGGVITFSEFARTTAGATGNASVNWNTAVPIGFGGIVLALKPLPVLDNFIAESTAGDWYKPTWAYRKRITIDQTKVGSGGVTNFPVLISRTDSDLQSKAQADGDDILFTSSDGTTKLSHEIERYVSGTGELVAWVKVPSVSSAAATELYMYYGNASVASQQDAVNVWDANFRGVWHLPNGTTLTADDSTSNAGNGTITAATVATGQIGGGASFSAAAGSRITTTPSPNIGAASGVTVSLWARYDSALVAGNGHAFDVRNGVGTVAARLGAANNWQIRDLASNNMLPAVGVINGSWHLYTVVINGTTATSYVDGIQQDTVTNALYSQPALNGTPCIGGAVSDGCGAEVTNKYGGLLDEIRISNTARSAAWILTEANNQTSPSTFYSVAAETTGSNAIGTQASGAPFTIKIWAQDQYGNTLTGFTGTATITSTGTLTAGSGTTAAFTAGLLASHSVTISNLGNFTITATNSAGAETGTSNTFTVTAGALHNFKVESTVSGGGGAGITTPGSIARRSPSIRRRSAPGA